MARVLAVLVLVGWSSAAGAQGLQFLVVDAESRTPLPDVKVTRFACMWQPRILLPPGRFWFPAHSFSTNPKGEVRFETYAGDDHYLCELDGHESAGVERQWFRWKAHSEPEGAYTNLAQSGGRYVVPLRKKAPSQATPASP
jgi:predicted amidohydrolase